MADRMLISLVGLLIASSTVIAQSDTGKLKEPKDKPVYKVNEPHVLEQLKTVWPDKLPRLAELKASDPAGYKQEMTRLSQMLERHLPLKKSNPGLADMVLESYQLGEDCRALALRFHMAADDADRARFAAELKSKVAEQVELEFRRQKLELADLEKRLDGMRKKLQEQSARKDEIVNERLGQWTGRRNPPKRPPAVAPKAGE